MANQTVKVVFEGKDQTSKAINSLKSNLNNATKAVDRIKSSLGGMTGALGAAAGAAGFGLLAKNALQTADSLGKTATKLGVTTDQLFKFQTQAELAGISTQTADMALQRFTRRTAEAAVGTGEAKGALEELRIDAEKLQALPLDQRMKVLADAFAEVKSPADRLRLAFKLFDSEGAAMVNMLKDGSGALIESEKRMKKLGITVKRDAAHNIEEFNDAVFLLGRRVQAAMINGLGKATPVMEKVADRLAEMAVPLTGKLLDGLDWLLKNLSKITRAFKLLIAAMVISKVIAFTTAVLALVKALGGMAVILAALASPIALLIAGLTAAAAAIYAFREEIGDAIDSLDDYLGITDKVGKAVKFFKGILGDAEDQVEDNTDTTKKATKETDDFEEALDNLNDTVNTAEPVLEEFGDTVDYVASEEIIAAARTDAFREALEDLREAARTGADEITDFESELAEFKKTVENTEATTEDFNNALLNSIEELTGVTFEARRVREEIDKVKAAIEAATNAGFDPAGEEIAVLNRRLEELGGELVEATRAADGLTASQREVLDEVKKSETEIKKLNDKLADLKSLYDGGSISAREYQIATEGVNAEIRELSATDLTGFEQAVRDAFNDTPLEEFLEDLDTIAGRPGTLDELIAKLIGGGGVKDAITGCFGVGPVNAFGDAIKNLFTGSGSALGGFGSALDGLTGALGAFFSGAIGRFSSFKTAIIRTLEEIAAAAIASVGINFLKNLIPGIATGGLIGGEGFADGGRVFGSGGPKEDKVLARLSAGEYVINAASVSKFGTGFFDMLNDGKMEMPGFQGGGFVGFDPASIAITSILSKIFGGIFDSIFGGESESRQMSKIRRGTRSYIAESFLEVIKQADENYGFGRRLYRRTKPQRQGGIDKLYDIILPTIMNDILPGSADLGHHRRVAEGINEIGPGFAEHIYDFLVGKLLKIRFDTIDFNMDDLVAKLFNDSNTIAGGSLFLNSRQFGGPLDRGQPSMVGEDGPELFIPNRNGSVSPIKGDSTDLQRSIDEMKDEIVMLRRQLSREISGRRPAGVR